MERIIGYKQAKTRMLEGCRVQESPRFNNGNVAYLKTPDGSLAERIRSDSWDKLRSECRCVETLVSGRRGQDRRYIWELVSNG